MHDTTFPDLMFMKEKNLENTVQIYPIHSKNAGLFQPKFGSNMDKPKYWVKNVLNLKFKKFKILTQLSLSTSNFLITFLTHHLGLAIFDPNNLG